MNTEKKISPLNKLLAGTAGIFILGLGLSFLFNWAITRILTQEEVGFFQYFISIITFGIAVIPMGFQSLIQREAVKLDKTQRIKINALTARVICIATLVFGLVWYIGVTQFNWVKNLKDFTGLYVSLAILPVYAFLTYYRALLQGQNQVYWSVLPEVLFRPGLLLVATIIFYLIEFDANSTHLLIVLFFILSLVLIPSVYKSKIDGDSSNLKTNKPRWLKQATTLLPIGLLYIINERIDVVMISKMIGPKDNAIYGIAFKLAAFAGFGLVIMNQVLVPQIAKHFANKQDNQSLQKIIKPTVRKALLLSVLVTVGLILIGKPLLSFFGKSTDNYSFGFTSMVILMIGQVVNVAMGSVGYILTMAKLEKYAILSIIVSISLNIVFNLTLLPIYGIEGAAIATAASMITWNLLMLIFVKRKTGINPTVF